MADSLLQLGRYDLAVVGANHPNTLRVLPSLQSKQQKIVVGDDAGVVTCLSVGKKYEYVVSTVLGAQSKQASHSFTHRRKCFGTKQERALPHWHWARVQTVPTGKIYTLHRNIHCLGLRKRCWSVLDWEIYLGFVGWECCCFQGKQFLRFDTTLNEVIRNVSVSGSRIWYLFSYSAHRWTYFLHRSFCWRLVSGHRGSTFWTCSKTHQQGLFTTWHQVNEN